MGATREVTFVSVDADIALNRVSILTHLGAAPGSVVGGTAVEVSPPVTRSQSPYSITSVTSLQG